MIRYRIFFPLPDQIPEEMDALLLLEEQRQSNLDIVKNYVEGLPNGPCIQEFIAGCTYQSRTALVLNYETDQDVSNVIEIVESLGGHMISEYIDPLNKALSEHKAKQVSKIED